MEEPPKFEDQEGILQSKSILQHMDKVLKSGKTMRRYLVRFKNYPFKVARWMKDMQLRDNQRFVNYYNRSCQE